MGVHRTIGVEGYLYYLACLRRNDFNHNTLWDSVPQNTLQTVLALVQKTTKSQLWMLPNQQPATTVHKYLIPWSIRNLLLLAMPFHCLFANVCILRTTLAVHSSIQWDHCCLPYNRSRPQHNSHLLTHACWRYRCVLHKRRLIDNSDLSLHKDRLWGLLLLSLAANHPKCLPWESEGRSYRDERLAVAACDLGTVVRPQWTLRSATFVGFAFP